MTDTQERGTNLTPKGSVCRPGYPCKACRTWQQMGTKGLRPVHRSAYDEMRKRRAV